MAETNDVEYFDRRAHLNCEVPEENVLSGKQMSKVREILFVTIICLTMLLNQTGIGQTLRLVSLLPCLTETSRS
jgi:hypothetical protein